MRWHARQQFNCQQFMPARARAVRARANHDSCSCAHVCAAASRQAAASKRKLTAGRKLEKASAASATPGHQTKIGCQEKLAHLPPPCLPPAAPATQDSGIIHTGRRHPSLRHPWACGQPAWQCAWRAGMRQEGSEERRRQATEDLPEPPKAGEDVDVEHQHRQHLGCLQLQRADTPMVPAPTSARRRPAREETGGEAEAEARRALRQG